MDGPPHSGVVIPEFWQFSRSFWDSPSQQEIELSESATVTGSAVSVGVRISSSIPASAIPVSTSESNAPRSVAPVGRAAKKVRRLHRFSICHINYIIYDMIRSISKNRSLVIISFLIFFFQFLFYYKDLYLLSQNINRIGHLQFHSKFLFQQIFHTV